MMDKAETKLNRTQYDLLRHCSETKNISDWNAWRGEHPKSAIQLVGADFANAALAKADLERADLRAANLQSAALADANLKDANLKGALLFKADLRNVDFQGAFLYGADLNGVNLEGANFFDAELTLADLRGAKLSGLRFDSKAVLDELAHPLSEKQIASAVFADRPRRKKHVASLYEEQPPEDAVEQPMDTVSADTRRGEAPAQLPPAKAPAEPHGGETPVDHQRVDAQAKYQDVPSIVRTIVFDQENFQPGISILSYFGEILRQKYGDNKANVLIELEGLKVQLTVKTTEGEKRVVEKALEDYIGVVAGRQQIAAFLHEPLAGLALKKKLDLVHLELQQTAALLSFHKAPEDNAVANSEDNAQRFHKMLLEKICISRLETMGF
ncbi:MAG: pentapeptide repeat-containing protein [Desulfobacteraceae bacterium]|nr:pentapeptide repeat-containing protein [Desulfobacteraceae bacterium]